MIDHDHDHDRLTALRQRTDLSYGEAEELIEAGDRVCRAGWNGKNMYVYERTDIEDLEPLLVLRAPDGRKYGWTVSQQDRRARDWRVAAPAVEELAA